MCGFSTFYTILPHNLIKENFKYLTEWSSQREGSPCLACGEGNAFFASEQHTRCRLWSCQDKCEALTLRFSDIVIEFGAGLYGQIVGVPVGTGFAPLVADLFSLFSIWGWGEIVASLSYGGEAGVIQAFGSTCRCLGDLLGVDNPCFEGMVGRIYPPG